MADYSSPSHQLYSLIHFGFSFLLLMVWLPRFFIPSSGDDRLEDRFGRFSIAVCIYIVMGYLLVLLKLYEVISVSIVIMLLCTRTFWRKGSAKKRDEASVIYGVWFYELTEIGFHLKNRWKQWRGKLTMIHKEIRLKNAARADLLLLVVLGTVIAISVFVRFYDAVRHAPPALSDGVVTLAWMKYISQRELYHDGIYPQGFHITLSLLSKFAATDELYTLRYTGPLNGVLTVISYYFCLSRMTGNKAAGIIAAALFGFGGPILFGGDWDRQAATNSQEFAMVFLFPSLYFILRYLQENDRRFLWNGMAACAVAGFTHSLIFAYVGVGIGVALIAVILSNSPRPWKRILIVSFISLGAVVITYAPIQIGMWAGVKLHGSSANFLTETIAVSIPILGIRDFVGLGSIAFISLFALIGWRNRQRRTLDLFAIGMGVATFVLYYWAPYATQSELLSSRSSTLWILYICFGTGFAWWSFWRYLPQWKRVQPLQIGLSGALALGLAFYVHVQPIIPYKMQWESEARAYLKIASVHQKRTWTIFGNDQNYALAFGNGYFQPLSTLITQYDPTGTPITRVGQDEYDPDVTPWMYVFQQKNVYKVNKSNSVYDVMQKRYADNERDNRLLLDWIAEYEPIHGRPPVVYEDENLRVYLIERPDAKDKRIRRMWGTS
ncbi:hypothetical protein [Cohnella sp.]|uniref:hypothetical protein n=1 Tax=Cohnella sp. TaxID=1883426 RepID=UPI003562F81E